MSKVSRENLKVADRAGFEHIEFKDGGYGVMVWVEREGRRAYLHGSEGPMVYPGAFEARRNIKRVRPDLEPTEI
ncbi:MAG: hypothetical protein B7Z62_08605 [Deltaproteobacteria bacterium 37-65-8]|nr:MAG: hypothetical protein B7Z62_08605 [Deltaproteobacteria bacterium 37-65-8]